jgi:hypothetical protein
MFHTHINPLNAELNPIRYLLALAGAHHFIDVRRITDNQIIQYTDNIIQIICIYIYTRVEYKVVATLL